MMILEHEFVEHIPEHPKQGIIYISIRFRVAVHLCCCGCGKEVVTPISPKGWELSFNGETVSLSPSIGNWNFKCSSHYFITKSKVVWARSSYRSKWGMNKDSKKYRS